MPYIAKEDRLALDHIIDQFSILSDGELNYIFTRLAHKTIMERGCLKYLHLNAVVGVFECAKQEFIRRIVSPYENLKIKENDCISDLDKELNDVD